MEFKCSGCDYSNCLKTNVIQHINRKNPCREGQLEVVDVHIDINCEFCNKRFTLKPNLNRHQKTCKVKNKPNEKIKQIIVEPVEINKTIEVYSSFIYLLQEREFIKLREPVYKIGITNSFYNRMNQYPKGSKVISVIPVKKDIESICLKTMRESFVQRGDIGCEYFEGELESIVKTLIDCCTKYTSS